MAVEVADKISELNAAFPSGNETAGQGDDHIRLLKHVLKTQFVNMPNVFDYAALNTRLLAIEGRLDAIELALSTDVVLQDNSGNVNITGTLDVAIVDVAAGLTVGGATSLQAVNAVTINVSDDLTVVGTLTAEHYRGGDVSVSGDIIAFDGS